MDDFTSFVYLKGTQSLNSLEVLGVKGTQAGTVEVLIQDSVTLTKIDAVHDVATHQIGMGELSGVSSEAGRDGEDVVLGDWDEGVILGERKRKGMKPEEPE